MRDDEIIVAGIVTHLRRGVTASRLVTQRLQSRGDSGFGVQRNVRSMQYVLALIVGPLSPRDLCLPVKGGHVASSCLFWNGMPECFSTGSAAPSLI